VVLCLEFDFPRLSCAFFCGQDPETHRVTDFFSFYSLPSTIINHPKHNLLEAAYLFYYASDVAFVPGEDVDGKLKKRLDQLIGDALIIANQAKFDVFNALTLMDNVCFLEDLKVSLCKLFIL
jgi:glycylpeptide N-tetradecanoyltransferase